MFIRFYLYVGILLSCMSTTVYSYDNLPDLPEPVNREISSGNIKDAVLDGDYSYALKLIEDLLLQKVHQALTDEKNIAKLVSRIAEKLEAILNDNTKTEQQKKEDILKLIDESMGPYKSNPVGSLNMAFKHSIEYGVTRLEWDHKIVVDACDGAYCGVTCDEWDLDANLRNVCVSWKPKCTYWTDYVKRIPDYYIYRQVNGVEKLITKLVGKKYIARTNSFSISDNAWNSIKSIYDFTTADFQIDVPDEKAFWYDYNSDYRSAGETLAYRVRVDNTSYQGESCGTEYNMQTTGFVDSDGDGKADFIPQSEYDKLFGKYYGWLIPVITMMQ